MSSRSRKASTCVTLVLIGSAAVSGCSDPPASSRRDAYASKQECLADWGDEKECDEQVAPRSGGTSSGSHIYWGPSGRSPSRNFGSSGSSSSSRSSSSSGSHSTSRGGFGSHGSSAS